MLSYVVQALCNFAFLLVCAFRASSLAACLHLATASNVYDFQQLLVFKTMNIICPVTLDFLTLAAGSHELHCEVSSSVEPT